MFDENGRRRDMIPEYEERFAFRLSTEDRTKIKILIESGKFKNESQLIRVAIKEFLEKNNLN